MRTFKSTRPGRISESGNLRARIQPLLLLLLLLDLLQLLLDLPQLLQVLDLPQLLQVLDLPQLLQLALECICCLSVLVKEDRDTRDRD